MIIKEKMLQIAARADISVLLQGESGTGKEVAARYIHGKSARAKGPFVAVNCGAIATNLAECFLEGARRGAYTGANTDQTGVVQAAHGGTLFLDEIGEMPLALQCKLLRILQEKQVMPLGSTRSIPVDFRLICATNRNLRQEVYAGRFREDLFFRLNVFPIGLPTLRERKDFEELAGILWREALECAGGTSATACGTSPSPCGTNCVPDKTCESLQVLSAGELGLLKSCAWPGNIRQLKNVLQRYALLKPHGTFLEEVLAMEFQETPSIVADHRKNYMQTPKWCDIARELENNHWNRSITAHKLGISRGSLNYQIKKHGLEKPASPIQNP